MGGSGGMSSGLGGDDSSYGVSLLTAEYLFNSV